ncbi:MAG: flagellar type III secretion system pore protein FliP [Firmicutes bacterium]|nr:flagellar type III secretion system pore protein FliP [Bacillota bacterium]HQD40803.1 flagellar type III secretion system pore protein FliP [Bacillota bacterium]
MNRKKIFIWLLLFLLAASCSQALEIPSVELRIGEGDGPEETAVSLQLLALLTVLSLAPAILIMLTSFTRIVVVLSFTRSALATNQVPPNQVLIGLALFITFFTMAPTWHVVQQEALTPYLRGELSQEQAFQTAMEPIREFMFKQTREKDLQLFMQLGGYERPQNKEDVPTVALIPAFVISELKTAFQIGFIIYVPFIVIDMVVASALMSMGMLMLPPVMLSLPFKILLFILADGWNLVVRSLLLSF